MTWSFVIQIATRGVIAKKKKKEKEKEKQERKRKKKVIHNQILLMHFGRFAKTRWTDLWLRTKHCSNGTTDLKYIYIYIQ